MATEDGSTTGNTAKFDSHFTNDTCAAPEKKTSRIQIFVESY